MLVKPRSSVATTRVAQIGRGYSERSMVENAIYQYKTIIGRRMRSRALQGQPVEMQLA